VAWQVFTEPPTLIGHRGMGKGVVHGHRGNTIESFLAALDAGVRWVEVDVQRTADDDLVVSHNPDLPDGKLLAEVSADDARRQGPVRVTELLNALPAEAGVVFDVKSSLHDAGHAEDATTGALLAQTCKRVLGSRPALACSFDPAALSHMREEMPGLALGLLTWLRFPIAHAVAASAHLDVQVLAAHAGSLWPNASSEWSEIPSLEVVVDRVHDAGREILVWCPSQRRARALARAGVDAMVVDDVPRHRKTRTRSGGQGHPQALSCPCRRPPLTVMLEPSGFRSRAGAGMGYTTDFIGHIDITPSLNGAEAAYLEAFSESRRWSRPGGPYAVPADPSAEETGRGRAFNVPPEGQPGLWCDWGPAGMDGVAENRVPSDSVCLLRLLRQRVHALGDVERVKSLGRNARLR
jgi:glycerophosphoryl diester phosphodiesterase